MDIQTEDGLEPSVNRKSLEQPIFSFWKFATSSYPRIISLLIILILISIIPMTVLASHNNGQKPAPSPTPTPTPTTNNYSYDVIIYGNNVSGAGVIRAITQGDNSGTKLKIAFIGTASYQQGAPSNGLSIEDLYSADTVATGFYKQFRDQVIQTYAAQGINPDSTGRLKYEPEVAQSTISSFSQAANVTYFSAHLVSGSDSPNNRYLTINDETKGQITLKTKYFVDASVEGDLARMLGASYRVGHTETAYNDLTGPKPATPSAANNYDAPESLSELLTLKIYPAGTLAPAVTSTNWPYYDPLSYDPNIFNGVINLSTFNTSWSMTTALLPDMSNGTFDKRELNEKWTDYVYSMNPSAPMDSYLWFFGTSADKARIRSATINQSINAVRYLQANGYGNIGIANVNPWPYVRGNLRAEGNTVYTGADVTNKVIIQSVATGYYAAFDDHYAYSGSTNYGYAYVNVPMGSLMPLNHPYLLVSTAISSDYTGYDSAVRTEAVRANMGYAAGTMLVIAKQKGFIPFNRLKYTDVSTMLQALGQKTTLP